MQNDNHTHEARIHIFSVYDFNIQVKMGRLQYEPIVTAQKKNTVAHMRRRWCKNHLPSPFRYCPYPLYAVRPPIYTVRTPLCTVRRGNRHRIESVSEQKMLIHILGQHLGQTSAHPHSRTSAPESYVEVVPT